MATHGTRTEYQHNRIKTEYSPKDDRESTARYKYTVGFCRLRREPEGKRRRSPEVVQRNKAFLS